LTFLKDFNNQLLIKSNRENNYFLFAAYFHPATKNNVGI